MEDGSFEPDLEFLAIKKKNPLASSGQLAPNYSIGYRDKELLYEFRCRLLIPMFYDEALGIIPEVSGKIIDFKDYKYSPTARRIYNLPGRFVLKKMSRPRSHSSPLNKCGEVFGTLNDPMDVQDLGCGRATYGR